MALELFLRSTENRFLTFFYVHLCMFVERKDDENTLVGATLSLDCPVTAPIAGVIES